MWSTRGKITMRVIPIRGLKSMTRSHIEGDCECDCESDCESDDTGVVVVVSLVPCSPASSLDIADETFLDRPFPRFRILLDFDFSSTMLA